jgi:hypothetical protein
VQRDVSDGEILPSSEETPEPLVSAGPGILHSSKPAVISQQPKDAGSTLEALSNIEIRVGVVDEYTFTRECIAGCLQFFSKNLKVLTFSSIDDCISSPAINFDLVLYHVHSGGPGQLEPSETIASLKPTLGSIPVIILTDLDAIRWMPEALKSGARGYIPTGSTSIAVAIEALRFAPAEFLSPLADYSSRSLRRRRPNCGWKSP